jgi:chromosome segregation ATPase
VNLNYDKIKSKIEHGGNAWTSYSDLFLVLSVIFLLLYVVSSLRTSTATIVTAQAYRKTLEENTVLRKQIEAYEVTKDEYMQRGASPEQLQMYQQMTKRLDLLSAETKEERENLEAHTRDLNEKEKALNQYQQMMKSMINANMIAQGRMHLRDLKLEEKEQRLEEKDRSISALSQSLADKQTELANKENEIAQNNAQIDSIRDKLAQSIKEINYAYRSKKKSQEAMQKEVERLKADSDTKIAALNAKNAEEAKALKSTQENLEAKNRELEGAIGSLREKEKQIGEAVEKARAEREAGTAAIKLQRERFERELASERLSAEEKLRREREFLAKAKAESAANDERFKHAQADLDGTRKNLHAMESSYQKSLGSLAKANATLKKDLKETLAKQAERRLLAQRIASSLAKAGINAVVDRESGEVTVQFLEEYFEYGRTELKPKMAAQLEKFFPAYASALFQGDGSSTHIANVDIVGFASPTFRGKFVDPESLTSGDREAVNFNMDLSYQRAKSIFAFVFDTSRLQFAHQKDLLPLVRVTGRSYLAERKAGPARVPASSAAQDYCQAHDCQKSQRVIIKFNLKEE